MGNGDSDQIKWGKESYIRLLKAFPKEQKLTEYINNLRLDATYEEQEAENINAEEYNINNQADDDDYGDRDGDQ
jgi:hypothetical protein